LSGQSSLNMSHIRIFVVVLNKQTNNLRLYDPIFFCFFFLKQSHYVAQANLQLTIPLVSVSQVLGLQEVATTPASLTQS
jgi:hypothetical protein